MLMLLLRLMLPLILLLPPLLMMMLVVLMVMVVMMAVVVVLLLVLMIVDAGVDVVVVTFAIGNVGGVNVPLPLLVFFCLLFCGNAEKVDATPC